MATANNNLTTNFNVDPYYDDYDQTDNFYRILYRPGYAVQARELTQQQTILQNQIHRFGNHVFRDGSDVSGATEVLDTVGVFRLKPAYAGSSIDVSSFEGKYVRTRSSEKVYKVKKAVAAGGGEYDHIYVQFVQSANAVANLITSTITQVSNNEIVDFSSSFINSNTGLFFSNTGTAQIISTSEGSLAKRPVGVGFLYSSDQSVRYHKGHFLRGESQTIAVAANVEHNISVGFQSTESVISSDDNSKLTDPARGSYNYAAPGADRLKIDLTLVAKTLDNISTPPSDSDDFFEIARIKNGELVRVRPSPDYNVLGDVLAQRTYEESGNYSVEGFDLNVSNTAATTANLVAKFSMGTAYVKGYRIRTKGTTDVALPKARATDTVTEQKITALYGNYLFINGLSNGLLESGDRIELHSNATPGPTTKIGEAYVKNLEYSSGTGANRIYKLFLFDVSVSATDKNLNNVKCIIRGTQASYTAYAAIDSSSITSFDKTGNPSSGSADVRFTSIGGIRVGQVVTAPGFTANTIVSSISFDTVTFSNPSTVSNTNQVFSFESVEFKDKDDKKSVFLLPHSHAANTVNVDYKFKRKFASVSFSGGNTTIQTLDSKERFASAALVNENFVVVVKSGGTGSTPNLQNLDMTVSGRSVTVPAATPGSPGQAIIELNDPSFSGVCDIIATIDVTADTRRVKTRTVGTKTFASGYPTSTTSLSLGYPDVIKINAIYEGNSTFVSSNTGQVISANNSANTTIRDVTSNFNLSINQRDSFYDHSTITLKPGLDASTNQILVDFDYYAHGGGLGYFSDLSYPDYNLIPFYTTSAGVRIALRDSIDFRPTRTSNTSSYYYTSSKVFDQNQIVDSQTFEVEADYSYYKRLVHKLVLDREGQVVLTSGESRLNNPPIPQTSSDTMLLATVFMNPYTYNEKDLRIKLEDNSRYTMRDIGALERRIENLEYYTSLNLLETQVQSTQFLDDNGDARYKNGFIVDPFNGHSVGNIFDRDYKASVDRRRQVMRPTFTGDTTPMVAQSGSGLSINSKMVTLPYTESKFVDQQLASDTINVNPFQVVSFVGSVLLDPSSDAWTDNKNVSVTVNSNGDLDHLSYLKSQEGLEYGSWQATGPREYAGTTHTNFHVATEFNNEWLDNNQASGVYTSQISTQGSQSVTKKSVQTTTDTSINTVLTNSVYYPFMRTRKVNFTIEGARPNVRLHLIFGGVDCTSWMAPDTFSSSRAEAVIYSSSPDKQVITDKFGSASGYFWVPNNQQVLSSAAYAANPLATVASDGSNARKIDQRFEAGTVDVIFCDNFINPKFSTSYAATTYSSRGQLDTYTTTTTMTKRYELVYQNAGSIQSSQVETGFFMTAVNDPEDIYTDMASIGSPWRNGATYTVDADARAFAENEIARVYEEFLGRRPEPEGYRYWLESYLDGAFGVVDATNPDTIARMEEIVRHSGQVNRDASVVYGTGENPNVVCQYGYDPLAQTFFIPGEFYPDGIFVTSVDIFMAQKDTNNLPLRVELRPTVNGFPSAEETIPLSKVSLKPSEVNANATTPTATNVKFKSPIHLPPGEYCVVLLTDSLDYISYIATIGNERIDGTGFVTEQPTLGSLFKSQNARTWTPQQESDLAFVMYKADFSTGANYSLTMSANNVARAAYNANVAIANTVGEYDIANISMPKFDDNKKFVTSYELRTKNLGGSVQPFERVLPNQDLYFDVSKDITTDSDLQLKVTFRSSDTNISPYFDLGATNVSLIKNVINAPPSGNDFVAETEASDNYAQARYITRRVALADGLSATALKVFVDQNMPFGSSVEVYYRVINSDDETNFEDRPYVLMGRRQGADTINQSISSFNEYEYFADNIKYTGTNGSTYNKFDVYSIKIVMYATSTAAAPSFRNFRAIALA